MSNPYKGLNLSCFWPHAMLDPAPGQIDPVTRSKVIGKNEKVATMGSCFAQHMAKYIAKSGLNYYVAEPPPEGMSSESSKEEGYGVFSARYGNVYTVRQALQLFDRAFGEFTPSNLVWTRDEIFLDPFRPQINVSGFDSEDLMLDSRVKHLSCVKNMFLESDWLVFTLGLTEAWRLIEDGAILPTAPGVIGGEYDPKYYEFVNFSVSEVVTDLKEFIRKVRLVNKDIKIILSVSPVPLIATYENHHVLVSTVYSKSVLRVACEEIEKAFQKIYYFPSFEIITSPANCGRYYQSDLRQVTDLGVSHVMRVFGKHFIGASEDGTVGKFAVDAMPTLFNGDIICDEEVIESAFKAGGFVK